MMVKRRSVVAGGLLAPLAQSAIAAVPLQIQQSFMNQIPYLYTNSNLYPIENYIAGIRRYMKYNTSTVSILEPFSYPTHKVDM